MFLKEVPELIVFSIITLCCEPIVPVLWIHLASHKLGIWVQSYGVTSVQFSCSVMSDSLRPRESQHARPPCPSPTPGVHSDSCPSIQWCHPAISSSVVPFSSCPQSLPASESFPMSQLFAWGGQSIGVSAFFFSVFSCQIMFNMTLTLTNPADTPALCVSKSQGHRNH